MELDRTAAPAELKNADAPKAALLDRFKRGQPSAYFEVRGRIRRIVSFRAYGIPEQDRAEIEQVAMIDVWRAVTAPEFEPKGFLSLINVIAARRCVDWRRRHRQPPHEVHEGLEDGGRGPFERLLAAERKRLLASSIRQLPEDCQRLIRLRFGKQSSYAEIADTLGKSSGALRVQLYRCVARLRVLMAAEDSELVRRRPVL